MTTVEFGNVSADMRQTDDSYGIAALQAFDAFLTGFAPVSEEILALTPTSVVIREYDAGDGFITLSAHGNLAAGQVSSVSVEAAGVIEYVFGNFTVDALGNVSGTATEVRANVVQDGSLITRFAGVSVPVFISDDFPALPSDETLLAGADTITGGSGIDYLLGYGDSDSLSGGLGNEPSTVAQTSTRPSSATTLPPMRSTVPGWPGPSPGPTAPIPFPTSSASSSRTRISRSTSV